MEIVAIRKGRLKVKVFTDHSKECISIFLSKGKGFYFILQMGDVIC